MVARGTGWYPGGLSTNSTQIKNLQFLRQSCILLKRRDSRESRLERTRSWESSSYELLTCDDVGVSILAPGVALLGRGARGLRRLFHHGLPPLLPLLQRLELAPEAAVLMHGGHVRHEEAETQFALVTRAYIAESATANRANSLTKAFKMMWCKSWARICSND